MSRPRLREWSRYRSIGSKTAARRCASKPNADTIEKYAADMLDGAVFPPVILFDDGAILWPGDGFHRIAATRRIKRTEINAEIRKGTARDAILHAVGANAAHGLPRTNADKRRAVETLLRDAEWQQLSDRDLAKLAKVSHVYVGTVRKELAGKRYHAGQEWKRFHQAERECQAERA